MAKRGSNIAGFKRRNGGVKRPRLIDIADQCGVSNATVSRVLNNDKNFSIRPEIRQKVVELARQIGYAPDIAARNLNRGQTHIIGVFGSVHTHVGEGVNDAVFYGIADAMHNQDYDVFFELTSRDPSIRPLPFWRFDGAILIQSPQPQVVEELDRRRVPYVCVNESTGKPVASVVVDDVMGATLAMTHLAGLGHQRFAYANAMSNYFQHYSVEDRHGTVTKFCEDHGLTLVPGHDQRFIAAEQFLRHAVLEHRATAVLSYDHRIAIAILGAAQRLGIKVPQDFSLVCFNDEFPVASVFPPLTVVGVSAQAMGAAAARQLLQAICFGPPKEPVTVRLQETLIIRASTAPASFSLS